jgi:predicted Zn-dependent peptidase
MKKTEIPLICFEQYWLENGLRVILYPTKRVPLVHVNIQYQVGSSFEEPGMSGFAHLFEHLMFQGSEHVAKNEHGSLVDFAGGRWNASTSKDRTVYYETLPANYLDLGLWLEADRMRSLSVTEDNFENQRNTVIEEKKQSYDNRPYGNAYLRFDELAYSNWAYGHPVIGSIDDLRAADLEAVKAFHQDYYGPGNAILVLAGDFDPKEAFGKVRQYFDGILDRTNPRKPDLYEPAQNGEKLEEITDPLAVLPAVIMGYHIPPIDADDYFAMSLLAYVLADGDSSRLYRRFVYENNWITGLFAGPNQYIGPQLFRIWFQIQADVKQEIVLRALDEELQKIFDEGITDQEMEKARNQVAYRFIERLSTVSQIGDLLSHTTSVYGDPAVVNTQLERYLSVSQEQIREAARKYLVDHNRTLISVVPGRQA